MSEINYTQFLQALHARQGASTMGGGRPDPVRARDLAFQTEMRMAMQLLGDGEDSQPRSAESFAGGTMMSDGLMMDALATISRIMDKGQAGGGASTHVVRAQVVDSPRNAVVDGALSAIFESGDRGVGAVGYDRVGGTSYGKFQIASRTGTMERFLNFLDEKSPEWADRLRAAGPANTGGRRGGMPDQWRAIAREDPERFELIQRQFIRQDHYQPAREKILAETGVDVDSLPLAAREVLWSTSVQHGATGAAEIFDRVMQQIQTSPEHRDFARQLIGEVYDYRKTQFGSSSTRVRESVQNRMDREKELALSMLESGGVNQLV